MTTIFISHHLFLTLYVLILFLINIQFILSTPVQLHGSILEIGCRTPGYSRTRYHVSQTICCEDSVLTACARGHNHISHEHVNYRSDRSPPYGEMHHSKSNCNTKENSAMCLCFFLTFCCCLFEDPGNCQEWNIHEARVIPRLKCQILPLFSQMAAEVGFHLNRSL